MKRSNLRHAWSAALLAAALLLLWLTLRTVPLDEVVHLLRGLPWSGLLALIGLNSAIFILLTLRWRILLNALGVHVPLLRLISYRLAGFAVSYVTPGTHTGGEPLQVWLVSRHQGTGISTAMTSVALDKILEVSVNYAFLAGAVLLITQVGVLDNGAEWLLLPWVGLLVLAPLFLLAAWWARRLPLTRAATLLRSLLARLRPTHTSGTKVVVAISDSEQAAMNLLHARPGALLAALLVTLLTWAGMIFEFWLMTRVLGLGLTPAEALVALAAARVAGLLPLPASLGALEAAQVLAMTSLGLPAAAGIAAGLLIRARDVSFAAMGLAIAAGALRAAGRPVHLLDLPVQEEPAPQSPA